MARMPNYIYSGGHGGVNPGPWAQAMSSLGQALFGDQAEIDRRDASAAEAAYRRAATDQLQLETEQNRIKYERQAALRKRFDDWAAGKFMPQPQAIAPVAAPASAPTGGLDASIFADAPVNFQAPTQFPSPVPPSGVTMAGPLPQLPGSVLMDGAPAPQMAQAPQMTPISDATPGYLANLSFRESRDNPLAQAPGSSAGGKYQFIDSTWQGLGGQGRAVDAPVETQDEMARKLTDQNYVAMSQLLGRPPTDVELYAAHHFGPETAAKLVTSPYGSLVANIVGGDAMQANSYLQGQTVGDWIETGMTDFPGTTWDGTLPATPAVATQADVAQAPAPAVAQAPAPAPAQGGIDATMFAPEAPQPTDPFIAFLEDLNPLEIQLLQTTPDFETTLNTMLEERATEARKAELEGNGVLAGTGLQQQMYNLYFELEEKRAIEGGLSPHDQLLYNGAVRELNKVKTYRNPDTGGIEEVTSPPLPLYEDKQRQPQEQPATGGTEALPATGDNDRVKTISEGNKPIPADIAGKLTMAQRGAVDVAAAIDVFAPRSDPNDPNSPRAISEKNVFQGSGLGLGAVPWTEGKAARTKLLRGIETIIRVASGAAVPDSEVKRYAGEIGGFFTPSSWDSDAEAMDKLNAAQTWINGMRDNLAKGRVDIPLDEMMSTAQAALSTSPGATAPTAPAGAQQPAGADDARRQELMNLDLNTITDPAELQRILDEMEALGM